MAIEDGITSQFVGNPEIEGSVSELFCVDFEPGFNEPEGRGSREKCGKPA
jgi:hypothetical protein